jgi:hypothetical protein
MEDMDSVILLDRESYGGEGLWSRKAYEQEMSSERSRVLVLTCGGGIVGVGCLSHVLDEGSIENIAVSAAQRGRGERHSWNLHDGYVADTFMFAAILWILFMLIRYFYVYCYLVLCTV